MGTASDLKEVLADIIPLIRFPVMKLTEFATNVVETGLLSPETLVPIFTYFGYPEAEKLEFFLFGFTSHH